ncbi:zinc transport system substrate-binding protein [Syntrophus gentianae]|uniref:Zinc transport system substrate-binding protein n=1 Tax=Syntrophus gentianae TaxID=43775 RepID=A0A1H7V680_9BACT|nr:zinc ABC transporter substrate-binding protein [Syntrophus gentianae]SEM04614.1 zinc transport system substrate-binding protein [Syntrophus gentianae]
MKKSFVAYMVLVLMLVFPPLARGEMGKTKVPVFVSIVPQAYFLERIGGKHVDVNVLIGKGQSPHSYEPTPKQMAKLAAAKAYFCIGVTSEKGILRKIRQSHRNLLIVETQRGIVYRYLDGHDHDHGEMHGKRHSAVGEKEPDPHIWMDPKLVKIQARNIQAALERLDPAHKGEYSENLRVFQQDLDRVNGRIARSLAPFRGSSMYVFHPAFGYFADAYGLKQVAIEIEGKEPSARQLAELIDRAKKERVKVMFVQPQFSRKGAEAVAKAIGGVVVPIDPLARDYLANLDRVAAAVEQGLR